jgi:uracil-DNA glycosylase family 4
MSEKLEAWLRYFADLQLEPFYLERGMSAAWGSRRREQAQPQPAPCQPGRPAAASPVSAESSAGQAARAPIAVAGSLFDRLHVAEGDTLETIRSDLGECTRCKLHRARTHIVFGEGNPRAELVFVGEGPGEEEDRQGLPFVGRAGQLLNQIIQAMGLKRQAVYICNVVKCRPPGNRTPERDEIETCLPFLERQLAVIRPRVIVCLGSVAAQALLRLHRPMNELRGQWFDYNGMRLLVTYHPAYLLRNPAAKRYVWGDLQKVMTELGLSGVSSASRSSRGSRPNG